VADQKKTKMTERERDKIVDEAIQRQIFFDSSVIEFLGVLVNHLADRGAIDREFLCRTVGEHVAIWSAPAPDRPNGRNLARAEALKLILAAISPPENGVAKENVN
jgi:hypothetical protein